MRSATYTARYDALSGFLVNWYVGEGALIAVSPDLQTWATLGSAGSVQLHGLRTRAVGESRWPVTLVTDRVGTRATTQVVFTSSREWAAVFDNPGCTDIALYSATALLKTVTWPQEGKDCPDCMLVCSSADGSAVMALAHRTLYIWAVHAKGSSPVHSFYHGPQPWQAMTPDPSDTYVITSGPYHVRVQHILTEKATDVEGELACACTTSYLVTRRVTHRPGHTYTVRSMADGLAVMEVQTQDAHRRGPVLVDNLFVFPDGSKIKVWDLTSGCCIASWDYTGPAAAGSASLVLTVIRKPGMTRWEVRALPPSVRAVQVAALAARRRHHCVPPKVWTRARKVIRCADNLWWGNPGELDCR